MNVQRRAQSSADHRRRQLDPHAGAGPSPKRAFPFARAPRAQQSAMVADYVPTVLALLPATGAQLRRGLSDPAHNAESIGACRSYDRVWFQAASGTFAVGFVEKSGCTALCLFLV